MTDPVAGVLGDAIASKKYMYRILMVLNVFTHYAIQDFAGIKMKMYKV